jgi:enamine deaminase RidA (YjgF/YER057c/UK114 family)
MSEVQVLLPEGWKRPPGWSAGIRIGDQIEIAGQFGWDGATHSFVSDDFGEQWDLALSNVIDVAAAGGASATDITTLRIYVTDLDAYRAAGPALGASWKERFGRHFPTITLVEVSRLTEPQALVEIEAVAHL